MRPDQAKFLAALEPKRVCLIKPSSLGDIVHALPVLVALRRRWPQAHLAWVVNRGLKSLVAGHPDLDEVIEFDRTAATPRWSGAKIAWSLGRRLRNNRFDVAVDLQGLFRSGLMTLATGAPVRVGLANAREGSRWAYTHRIEAPPGIAHAVDRLWTVVRAFGADAEPLTFRPAVSEADRLWAQDRLAGVARPRIAFNLGARWVTKRWPPEHFADVARWAATSWGAGIVVVGAPEDRPLADAFTKRLGEISVCDLCGQSSLPQLAAIAEQTDLVISNDTGPLHLAAATGTPVLGIYTCTSPERTGPYGPHAHTLATKIWCAASLRKTCDRMECMSELTPLRVQDSLQQLFPQWSPSARLVTLAPPP